MGKIVVSENVTLDGVVQDPAGAEGFRRGGWVGRVGERGREEAAEVLFDEALGFQSRRFNWGCYSCSSTALRQSEQQSHMPDHCWSQTSSERYGRIVSYGLRRRKLPNGLLRTDFGRSTNAHDLTGAPLRLEARSCREENSAAARHDPVMQFGKNGIDFLERAVIGRPVEDIFLSTLDIELENINSL